MNTLTLQTDSELSRLAPVVIGGVGGSGTRLISEILLQLGYFLGDDLNEANDNLWFALLFTRPDLFLSPNLEKDFGIMLDIFLTGMTRKQAFNDEQKAIIRTLALKKRAQHGRKWLQKRADRLLAKGVPRRGPWGWKAPNTHIYLDMFNRSIPNMRYIHVVRNGLDMAHSTNQNQLRLWGEILLQNKKIELNPFYSLKYWCVVHKRILTVGENMGTRFLFLNYDEFCSNPTEGVIALLDFLGIEAPPEQKASLRDNVCSPPSIGRFKEYGSGLFDPVDIEYVRSLGFDTHFA